MLRGLLLAAKYQALQSSKHNTLVDVPFYFIFAIFYYFFKLCMLAITYCCFATSINYASPTATSYFYQALLLSLTMFNPLSCISLLSGSHLLHPRSTRKNCFIVKRFSATECYTYGL